VRSEDGFFGLKGAGLVGADTPRTRNTAVAVIRLEKDQRMKMKRRDAKSLGAELLNTPEPLGGPTVMVVDEDLGLICRLGKILAEAGYQVVPALNSRQAASLIEKLCITPDLVISNPSLLNIKSVTRHNVSAELKVFDNRRPDTGPLGNAARERTGMHQGAGHGA